GESSGRVVWVNHQTGQVTTLDLATLSGELELLNAVSPDNHDRCDPATSRIPCNEEPWPGGPGAPAPDPTYLTYFKVYFSDGVGSSEIEYRAKFYDESDQLVRS